MSDDNEESRNEVQPHEAALSSVESSDDAAEEFSAFDEINDGFLQEEIMQTTAADGMPAPTQTESSSDIPSLSPETLVCMADTSKFVRRDKLGRILAEWERADVTQVGKAWFAPLAAARATPLMTKVAAHNYPDYPNSELRMMKKSWHLPPELNLDIEGIEDPIEVHPLRRQCEHYVRQLMISLRDNRRGLALPFTLFLVTMITLLLAMAFSRTAAEVQISNSSGDAVTAYAVAQGVP